MAPKAAPAVIAPNTPVPAPMPVPVATPAPPAMPKAPAVAQVITPMKTTGMALSRKSCLTTMFSLGVTQPSVASNHTA